jgi:2'-5' RNA ligase
MNPEKRKRLFVGIAYRPAKAVRQVLADLQEMAQDPAAGLRPVPAENLHITLKFLGMVPELDVSMICQVLQQVARHHSPMALKLRGFGCFKQALWLGIAEHEDLQRLATELDQALSIIGVERERKPFTPHLTIARLRSDARLKISELQARYGPREWDDIRVESIDLFESETLPEGARYTSIFSASLAS